MHPSPVQALGTALFALAILHTFLAGPIGRLAHAHPHGSWKAKAFHLLGEVELVFGLWAALFLVGFASFSGPVYAGAYLWGQSFVEPLFVFAIMALASTRPVISFAGRAIDAVAGASAIRGYWAALVIGPLLGSLITEPAAMTVTALLLRDRVFREGASSRLKYLTMAALFVNVSIGGVLTHFAAPPVVMVARPWGWDTPLMLSMFGWKAAIAVVANASLAAALVRRELEAMPARDSGRDGSPAWLVLAHLLLLAALVVAAHHPLALALIFAIFWFFARATRAHQDPLRVRESLLVAFFLAGLVVLGGVQSWWLAPLISKLDPLSLFVGATALTAVTDNAALTYLGSRVQGISDVLKYALVAGAVSGGGLTVIANAPNPAGFAILKPSFGERGVSPLALAAAAFFPTVIAMACFWLL